ncbi:MAG: hypothetical protein WA066_02935 [Candidatus Omnitrophota bacterium]
MSETNVSVERLVILPLNEALKIVDILEYIVEGTGRKTTKPHIQDFARERLYQLRCKITQTK